MKHSFFLSLAIAVIFSITACSGGGESKTEAPKYQLSQLSDAIDPVCKMKLASDDGIAAITEHGGKTYGFCAKGCKTAFEKDPHKYLGDHAH